MKEIHADPFGTGGNIDPETRHKLLCINKSCIEDVYRMLGKKLMKPGKENEMEDLVKDYMMSKHLPDQAKEKLRKMVQMGMFNSRQAEEIDGEVERELSLCMDYRINRAIKKGELKPPSKGVHADAFSERMRKRNEKTTRQLFG